MIRLTSASVAALPSDEDNADGTNTIHYRLNGQTDFELVDSDKEWTTIYKCEDRL